MVQWDYGMLNIDLRLSAMSLKGSMEWCKGPYFERDRIDFGIILDALNCWK